LKQIIKKANISSLLEYSETSGRLGHKQSGQRWLSEFGLNVPAEQVLITSGLQNSLAIILTSLFRFGDKIVTNSVVYPGIKNIANSLGIQLIPVPYIGQTMNMDYLLQLCKNEKIKGIYVNPDHQNPTTIDMSERERMELSSIIKQYGLICIEDATYSFLSSPQNIPITRIIPQQSIYISTVSNSLSAGLRVAFLTMPLPFLEKLKKGNNDINVISAPLEVEISSQLIKTGVAQKMIYEKISCLHQRNKLVEEYLSDYQVKGTLNSQFRWLPLPLKWTGKQFEMMAKEKGVQVFCCERFIVGSALVEPAVRLAISTPKNMDDLELGLQILRKLLE
jgi:DNA-binding transcriptional MocR family regulator